MGLRLVHGYCERIRADAMVIGEGERGKQAKGEIGKSVAGAEETDKDGHIGGGESR